MRALVPCWFALALACGDTAPPPPTTFPPVAVELGPLPDTPSGRALAWVIQELNAGGLSVEQIESGFTQELLDGFPADDLSVALGDLSRKIAPLNADRVVGEAETHRTIAAVLSRGADWYQLKVTTSPDPPHLIAGIFYQKDQAVAAPPPSDWERFAVEVRRVAPRVQFLAAEVGETCDAVTEIDAASTVPVGSAFKLYVLSTLVDQIGAGTRRWSDVLPIADAQKSLPSGFLHLRTAGSTLTLEQYATSMIEDSDNTATDHMMHLLGRESVEATFASAGHGEPAKNRPLMTTREFFLLKLHLDDAGRAAYLAKPEADRRAYLASDLAGVDVFSLGEPWRAWRAPLSSLDTIEWFASTADLCRVMLRLRAQMALPEGAPLREILSRNTVFDLDRASWSYGGFKGGAEAGLLSVTWLLERKDARWFVVSLIASNPSANIAQGSVVRQARNAIDLLAKEP